ncbi:hypothetical protein [Cryobacterium sp. Y29]|uniref:hypothetical protein n=1 Tax=Cryobacterium sp. Y29 TaxID=2048285 RepID=UPI0011AFEF64|nr:hypothetical protein [Cryobacterium sp. Y29]
MFFLNFHDICGRGNVSLVTALHTDDSEGHMPQRNTPVRNLHDIELAAWFGGSLMGAVELNGAAATVKGPKERISVATTGWKHWAPVQMARFVAVGIGGAVLILGDTARRADSDSQAEGAAASGCRPDGAHHEKLTASLRSGRGPRAVPTFQMKKSHDDKHYSQH